MVRGKSVRIWRRPSGVHTCLDCTLLVFFSFFFFFFPFCTYRSFEILPGGKRASSTLCDGGGSVGSSWALLVLPLCVVVQGGEGPPCPIRWRPWRRWQGGARRFSNLFLSSTIPKTHPPTLQKTLLCTCWEAGGDLTLTENSPQQQQLVYSNAPFLFLFFNTFRVKDSFFSLSLLFFFLFFYLFSLNHTLFRF